MNSPSSLRLGYLSPVMSTFKLTPGASNIATSRPSYDSTTKVNISASWGIVGGEASSLDMYPLCVLTSAHV